MNKKIIGLLSVVAVLGGAVLLSTRTGGFGSLSSSAIGGPACSETDEARYTQSAEHIANLTEQIKKIQTNTKERQENKEKNRNDVEEIQKDIKTLQSTVKKINEDVQKNCGDVTKKVQAGGRGGSIDNPAYGKCEDRKKEVQTAQTKIQTLQTTLKNKNETLEKIVDTQKEAQKSLRELEGKLADHTEYRAAYEACKASLAGNKPIVPETGGDLPPTTPETNTTGTSTSNTTNTTTNTTTTGATTNTNTSETSTTGTDTIPAVNTTTTTATTDTSNSNTSDIPFNACNQYSPSEIKKTVAKIKKLLQEKKEIESLEKKYKNLEKKEKELSDKSSITTKDKIYKELSDTRKKIDTLESRSDKNMITPAMQNLWNTCLKNLDANNVLVITSPDFKKRGEVTLSSKKTSSFSEGFTELYNFDMAIPSGQAHLETITIKVSSNIPKNMSYKLYGDGHEMRCQKAQLLGIYGIYLKSDEIICYPEGADVTKNLNLATTKEGKEEIPELSEKLQKKAIPLKKEKKKYTLLALNHSGFEGKITIHGVSKVGYNGYSKINTFRGIRQDFINQTQPLTLSLQSNSNIMSLDPLPVITSCEQYGGTYSTKYSTSGGIAMKYNGKEEKFENLCEDSTNLRTYSCQQTQPNTFDANAYAIHYQGTGPHGTYSCPKGCSNAACIE